MGHPDGAHTHGSSGGAGLLLAVVVVVLFIGAAAAKAVSAIWRTVVTILEVVAWTALSIAALAVLAGAGYAAWRIRARVIHSRPRPVIQARAEVIQLGTATPERDAIEAPRQRADGWPLPGQWEEIRARIGRDGS